MNLGEEVLQPLVDGLTRHKKVKLSEHGDLTPEVAMEVYKEAL